MLSNIFHLLFHDLGNDLVLGIIFVLSFAYVNLEHGPSMCHHCSCLFTFFSRVTMLGDVTCQAMEELNTCSGRPIGTCRQLHLRAEARSPSNAWSRPVE